jgi:hypothetical protein
MTRTLGRVYTTLAAILIVAGSLSRHWFVEPRDHGDPSVTAGLLGRSQYFPEIHEGSLWTLLGIITAVAAWSALVLLVVRAVTVVPRPARGLLIGLVATTLLAAGGATLFLLDPPREATGTTGGGGIVFLAGLLALLLAAGELWRETAPAPDAPADPYKID